MSEHGYDEEKQNQIEHDYFMQHRQPEQWQHTTSCPDCEQLQARLATATARVEALRGRLELLSKFLSNDRIKEARELLGNTLQGLAAEPKEQG